MMMFCAINMAHVNQVSTILRILVHVVEGVSQEKGWRLADRLIAGWQTG